MTLVIPGLLTPPEAAAIRAAAERLDFADGRETDVDAYLNARLQALRHPRAAKG